MVVGDFPVEVVEILKDRKVEVTSRFGVSRIGVFGSQARREASPGSDMDVLVQFREGEETFDNYMDLKFYLEDLFGRDVDLVILEAIRPRLRGGILAEAVYV
jgi:predicted nucleotidyltransferase